MSDIYMKKLLYNLENISKTVHAEAEELTILKNINMQVYAGESIALVGASGSGKSTLLHLLGVLDSPTTGTILFEEQNLNALSPDEKAKFRNQALGFVFQFHHLLPEFSTVENVAMQAFIAGIPQKEALALSREALVRVGLEHRLHHKVTTLSGGERQRAGIARAILLNPKVLLADEPTGNLDEASGQKVVDLLLELNRDKGMTLIMVTHNHELASRMGRSFELKSGELHEVSYL